MSEDVQRFFSGSQFEQNYGYCRAVATGDYVFVSGTTGYDYATGEISGDPAKQTHKTLDNIDTALRQFNANFDDLLKLVTYFVDQDDWDAIGAVLKERLAGVHPVNSSIRTGLIRPEMKVEISATALRRQPG